MNPSQEILRLCEEGFYLTVAEASVVCGVPPSKVEGLFKGISETNGAFEIVYTKCGSSSVNVVNTPTEGSEVFALQRKQYSGKSWKGSTKGYRFTLLPQTECKTYLKTREQMENFKPATLPLQLPVPVPSSTVNTAPPTEVKTESIPAPLTHHVTVPPSTTSTSITTTTTAPVKDPPSPSAHTGEKKTEKTPPQKQMTLFGSPTKRTREESVAKAEKKPSVKPKRVKKEKNTNNLAKLAKASSQTGEPRHHTEEFLFDEVEDSTPSHSLPVEEVVTDNSISLNEMVFSTSDDIVLCDNAPPLAFCEPTTNPAVQRAAPSVGSSQPSVAHFFSKELGAFQSEYTKETESKMEKVNGEYICSNHTMYRSKKTNELISEAEYKSRMVKIQVQSHPIKPVEDNALQDSPPAATKAGSSLKVSKKVTSKEVKKNTPTKTLFSFFNKSNP